MSDKIRIFTSPLCPPCIELKKKLSPEELAKIEFVDIHTDEGFKEAMDKKILGVPFVEKNGRKCKIIYKNNNVIFDCEDKNS